MPTAGVSAGLLAALSFGAGDFAGASAARRGGTLPAVAGAQGIGLIALVVAVLVVQPPLPDLSSALTALVAGVAGAIGLAALYRGMALGSMGLITALSGAGSLAIPLVAGAALGSIVGPLQLLGVGCVAAAAAAASGASRSEVGRRALALAALAAVAFGSWYVLIDLAAAGGDPLWALVLSRSASAAVALGAAVGLGRLRREGYPFPTIATAGLFDVGGNALYVVARGILPVGLAAALTGLYPVVTMVLARVLIGEHLPRLGQLGVALALLGVVFISVGG